MLNGEVRPRAEYHYPHWVMKWPVTCVCWPGLESKDETICEDAAGRCWWFAIILQTLMLCLYKRHCLRGCGIRSLRRPAEKLWKRCARLPLGESGSVSSTTECSGCWGFLY